MISNMPGLLSPTRRRPSLAAAVHAALAALVAWGFTCSAGKAVTIDMVTVGNPGNDPEPDFSMFGAVSYEYQIGKYVVTIGQYAEFLNAVAKTDPHGLYNESMNNDLTVAGILRSGSDGSYTYTVIGPSGTTPAGASSPGNRPITYVSWFDAARFANWMSNGQPTGVQGPTTTENGAYDVYGGGSAPPVNMVNPNTNAPPTFRIPTEDEWYKAAYYDPTLNSGTGGYWKYATQSNEAPGNTIGSGTNQANIVKDGKYAVDGTSVEDGLQNQQNYLTDVGAFTSSGSFYGTFDQTGNVFELLGEIYRDIQNNWSVNVRGSPWSLNYLDATELTYSYKYFPSSENNFIGFRLASPPVAVPEPATWAMGLAAGVCVGWRIVRRSR